MGVIAESYLKVQRRKKVCHLRRTLYAYSAEKLLLYNMLVYSYFFPDFLDANCLRTF